MAQNEHLLNENQFVYEIQRQVKLKLHFKQREKLFILIQALIQKSLLHWLN